jgi:hypothetical protein
VIWCPVDRARRDRAIPLLHTADGARKYLTAGERSAFLREAELADRAVRTLCMTLAYALRPRANTRVTRGHFDQRQSKMAVAEHVAAILRFATDLCDTENGGIPWGLVLSRNS